MKRGKYACALLCALLSLVFGTAVAKAQTTPADSGRVRVAWATFNVRYDNPGDKLNSWKYRRDTVCGFIRARGLGIVGMQEVLHNQLEDLKAGLPGYAAVGVGRDDGKQAGEYSPLFYRTDKFELLDSSTFWLSQYPDSAGFIGWDGACTRIATWAKLRDRATGKVFMAVNTHFDHVGTEARRQSALLIIRRIREIVGDRPAVLTGDFNVNDRSEAYQTLTTNNFVLRDAYKVAERRTGPAYTFHDFGREPMERREKIDFIFVTPQVKVLRADIAPNPETPTGYLSDHNPHMALLEF